MSDDDFMGEDIRRHINAHLNDVIPGVVANELDKQLAPLMAEQTRAFNTQLQSIEQRVTDEITLIRTTVHEGLQTLRQNVDKRTTGAFQTVEENVERLGDEMRRQIVSSMEEVRRLNNDTLTVAAEAAQSSSKRLDEQRDDLDKLENQFDTQRYAIGQLRDQYQLIAHEVTGDEHHAGLRDDVKKIKAIVTEHSQWHSMVMWLFRSKQGQRAAVAALVLYSLFSDIITVENIALAMQWLFNLL